MSRCASAIQIFAEYLNLDQSDDLYRAAFYVLSQNIVHGDARTMRTHDDMPITFAEWGYLGMGRFQRRDFRFDSLTQSSATTRAAIQGAVIAIKISPSPAGDANPPGSDPSA